MYGMIIVYPISIPYCKNVAPICKTEPVNIPKRNYDMEIVCITINKLHDIITGAFK